jgi:Ca2+-binding EF-hand superfamily protein
MKGFNSSAKLKDAIHCFIAAQMISAKDTKELKEAFLAMDKNNDGKLSKEEMLAMYASKMDQQKASEEVE